MQHLGDIYIMSRKVIINKIERGIFRPFILLKWNLLVSSFIQQEGKGCGNGRGWGLSLFYLAEKYHFNRVHEYPSNNILILSYDRKVG